MINWKILNLKSQKDNGLVLEATYECRATEGVYSERKIGVVILSIGDINNPDFIPYEDLTEAITLSWVMSELGDEVSGIEAGLTSIIAVKVLRESTNTIKRGTPWDGR